MNGDGDIILCLHCYAIVLTEGPCLTCGEIYQVTNKPKVEMNYILAPDGKTPILCEDMEKYFAWQSQNPNFRHVKKDHVGQANVSTVFLSIDHGYMGSGPPILWETMIFGGSNDGYQARASSHEEALRFHDEAVKLLTDERDEAVALARKENAKQQAIQKAKDDKSQEIQDDLAKPKRRKIMVD